jgi:hypothetical protein
MRSNQPSRVPALLSNLPINRGMAFGVIIITALLSFEVFNYSTTDFALTDLLGDLRFAGLRWATILSIAFCGIDFAGIARLFTPEGNQNPHNDTWYLFGAWLLAATMNAMLTWWGVSLAILNHQTLGNDILGRETLLRAVPIFVALLVWLIRVLIIGTFSAAGERLFSLGDEAYAQDTRRPPTRQISQNSTRAATPVRSISQRPAPIRTESARPSYSSTNASRKPAVRPINAAPAARPTRSAPLPMPEPPEPSYQPLNFNAVEYIDADLIDPPPNKTNTPIRRF